MSARHALVLGGTGPIGIATARRLSASGWTVRVSGRNPDHVPSEFAASAIDFVASDRRDPAQLAWAIGGGADLLVDCLCYTADDAADLLRYRDDVGVTVMISASAVYVDAAGRHINSAQPPRFVNPISETSPTMAPANADYMSREGYGACKVAAERLLLDGGGRVAVLRPGKVHGIGTARPREWYFVKRVLDGRRSVLIRDRGGNAVPVTAAANLASLIETVADTRGPMTFNCADPDQPRAIDIARAITAHLNHEWDEVRLDDAASALGRSPWSAPYPMVLDCSRAARFGYQPAGTYAETVRDELSWLVSQHRSGTLRLDVDYFATMFDYAAEDTFLVGVEIT